MLSDKGQIYYIAQQIASFFKEEDFIRKVKVTLGMLFLYRALYFIPLPGLNLELLDQAFGNKLMLPRFIAMFYGNIRELSILSIGISSYITCSLIFNFLHLASDYFKELKKDGAGRNLINTYIRYASFIHAFVFAYGGSYFIKSWIPDLVLFPSKYFHITSALYISVGAMITVWIADQISLRGIGNGSSIIIFINIISNIPESCINIYKNLRAEILSYKILFLFSAFLLILLFFIVYCEKIYREYKVLNISKKNMNFNMMPENSLVIKLNPAGIMPAMFLAQFFTIPSFIKNFWDYTQYYYGALFQNSMENGGYAVVFIQGLILFLTSYTFAEVLFNAEDKAQEFKSRTMIPGVRPGEETKLFLEDKLFSMSMIGGAYLVIICCVPSALNVFLKGYQIDKTVLDLFNVQGASLIIVVGVVNDFIDKIIAGIKYKLTELNLKVLTRKF